MLLQQDFRVSWKRVTSIQVGCHLYARRNNCQTPVWRGFFFLNISSKKSEMEIFEGVVVRSLALSEKRTKNSVQFCFVYFWELFSSCSVYSECDAIEWFMNTPLGIWTATDLWPQTVGPNTTVCQCFPSGNCKQACLPAGGAVAPSSSTAPGSAGAAAAAAAAAAERYLWASLAPGSQCSYSHYIKACTLSSKLLIKNIVIFVVVYKNSMEEVFCLFF